MRVQLNMGTEVVLDARAAASTYVVFGLMFVPLCCFSILVFRQSSSTILCSSVLLLIFVWIRTYRIVVDGAELSYTSLFGGRQSVQLEEIASARTEIGIRDALGPMYRLVLELSGHAEKSQIVINMKVFRREDMATLIGILRDKMTDQPRFSLFKSKDAS